MEKDFLPKNVTLQGIHTLETDTAETVVHDHVSKTQLFVDQQKQVQENRETKQENMFHSILSIFLMVVGILLLILVSFEIFIYVTKADKMAPIEVKKSSVNELIDYSNIVNLTFPSSTDASSKSIIQVLSGARVTGKGVTFFNINISGKDLLKYLSPSIPDGYYRSLKDKNFYGGLSSGNFLIIKTDSYQTAFAYQLGWESSMSHDILPLFVNNTFSSPIVFQDKVISNKDTRIALDSNNKIIFVYGFSDPQTIIFAENEITYKEVLSLLLRKQL